jgi:DNA-binding NtrC family response regulator
MSRYSVLVVDDDPAVLETMVAILEQSFDVVGSTSARDALELLHAQRFHVVVSDWRMPDADGMQFLRKVRALPRPTACLLVTGHLDALANEVDWEDRKTVGLLQKPFDPAQLISRVEHLARLTTMRETTRELRAASERITRSRDD